MPLKYAFLLVLLPALLPAQTIRLDLDPAAGCNFDGSPGSSGPVYGFDNSQEAEAAVRDILRQVGLPQNFLIKASNVPNAQAHVSRGERYILYSQQFMDDIANKTSDYWSKIAVLAHEIGHHLLGHTLKDDGSRPLKELDADQWSGFVLYKMGATLAQAQLAAGALTPEQGSATHPPRNARLEAIAVGYQEARELGGATPPTPPDNSPPARTETKETRTPDTSPAASENQVVLGGKTYRTVRLNGLTWMAENLDYEVEDSWCYDDDPENCREFGRLYTWETAKKACREVGWRLPTDEEWRELAISHGGLNLLFVKDQGNPSKANKALTEGGTSGFNAQLGGFRNDYLRSFLHLGNTGGYWSATERKNPGESQTYHFGSYKNGEVGRSYSKQSMAYSCRCVRD